MSALLNSECVYMQSKPFKKHFHRHSLNSDFPLQSVPDLQLTANQAMVARGKSDWPISVAKFNASGALEIQHQLLRKMREGLGLHS